MTRATPLRALLAVILFLPLAAFAQDTASNLDDLRAQRAAIGTQRNLLIDRADWLDTLAEERRTLIVFMPLETDTTAWAMATEREAVGYITVEYLEHIARNKLPFSADDLAALIKTRLAMARNLEGDLTYTADTFRRRASALDDEWKRLEAEIARLMNPTPPAPPSAPSVPPAPSTPASGNSTPAASGCAVFAEAVKLDQPLSNLADLHTNTVRIEGDRNGKHLKLLLSWSAPPPMICPGDTVQVSMTVRNGGEPLSRNNFNYIAMLGVSNYKENLTFDSCTRSPTWLDAAHETTAPLAPDEAAYSSTCTFHAHDMFTTPAEGETFYSIGMSSAVMGAGAGEILYRYVVR